MRRLALILSLFAACSEGTPSATTDASLPIADTDASTPDRDAAAAPSDDAAAAPSDDASATPSADASPTHRDASTTNPDASASRDAATGLEGFGAITRGAESSPTGFTTCHVTSLADDGAGTLRDCLSAGNRRVVFDLGGTITLESDLNIRYSYVTVDGFTAPAPGITIAQPNEISTTIEARASTGPAHDIIIRYLRNDGMATSHLGAGDIWGLDGENAPVYNIVIDHVTGTRCSDGIFDLWEDVKDVTISWSLITDTITALHMSGNEVTVARPRVSVHHNVFARNNERQVRLRHTSGPVDFVNNVIYGWGWIESGAGGLRIVHDPGEPNPSVNVINNVFHYVPGLHGDEDDGVQFDTGADRNTVFFSGNIVPAQEMDSISTVPAALTIPAAAQVTTFPAADLGARVVPFAGTHYPTAAEAQLLNEIAGAL